MKSTMTRLDRLEQTRASRTYRHRVRVIFIGEPGQPHAAILPGVAHLVRSEVEDAEAFLARARAAAGGAKP